MKILNKLFHIVMRNRFNILAAAFFTFGFINLYNEDYLIAGINFGFVIAVYFENKFDNMLKDENEKK